MYYDIEFVSKPSKPTIISRIKKALATGKTFIVIRWGENQITVEKSNNGLIGNGWIGKNSGYDIALSLTRN
jgi:hypothetical protein